VTRLPLRALLDSAKPQTCVMNPPFGTRRKGIDALFVQTAIKLVSGAVYSLHKTSTRAFFLERAPSWGASATVVAQLKFDLPKMYAFHDKSSADIHVDLIRFQVGDTSPAPQRAFPQPEGSDIERRRRERTAARHANGSNTNGKGRGAAGGKGRGAGPAKKGGRGSKK